MSDQTNALAGLDAEWRGIDADVAALAWKRAALLAKFSEVIPDHANLVRHVSASLGIHKSEVTRLEHWADMAAKVPDAKRLGSSSKADAAWKIAKRGVGEAEAVRYCLTHSVAECTRAIEAGTE